MRIFTAWFLPIVVCASGLVASEKARRSVRRIEPIVEELSELDAHKRITSLEKQYDGMREEISSFSLPEQQKRIRAFYENQLKPVRTALQASDLYIPFYYTLENQVTAQWRNVNLRIAVENIDDSVANFNYLCDRYKWPLDAEKKELAALEPQLQKMALQYGTSAQIKKLCSAMAFSPQQIDTIHKRILASPIDEQISLVGSLHKNCASFSDYIGCNKQKQQSAAWHISLRHCIASAQLDVLLDSFKGTDGCVMDQLFMDTMLPILSVKKGNFQRAVVSSLEAWSHQPCVDDPETGHARREAIVALINKNSPFKRVLESESGCGAAVMHWWAVLQMIVWKVHCYNESVSKTMRGEQLRQAEGLRAFKRAESTFARISPDAAAVLAKRDNEMRLTMHRVVLRQLLAEPQLTEKMAYALCERALKSGVNIAELNCVASIAPYIAHERFFKLVEPYLDKNPDLCYSLGVLYETGFTLAVDKTKGYVWLPSNSSKAQEFYKKILEKGDTRAPARLLDLMQRDKKSAEDIELFLQKTRDRFPGTVAFAIQGAMFLCDQISGVDKNTINARTIVKLDKISEEIDSLNSRIRLFSPELVCFSALKTSHESLSYDVDAALGAPCDEAGAMGSIAAFCHATYALSVHPDSPLLSTITDFFNSSVYANLKRYAEKIVSKDPKDVTFTDLCTITPAGYMILRYEKEKENKADMALFKKIVALASHKDISVQWPPLMHALTFATHTDDKNQDALFSHIKAALQEGASKKEFDSLARYEAEDALEGLAMSGSLRAHMEFMIYNKEDIKTAITKLMHYPVTAILKEELPHCVANVHACGAYALLKDKFLKSTCTTCRTEFATVLKCWTGSLVSCDDETNPLLKPFFDDLTLFKPYLQE